MTLIAHSPSSSPLYELAEVEYLEKDPARPELVVMSMMIQPAVHILGLRFLSYDPSVTPTNVPAFRADISRIHQNLSLHRGRSFPTSIVCPTS